MCELDFKDINFRVKKDTQKIEIKNSIETSALGYERKKICVWCVKKYSPKKCKITEEKSQNVHFKDFNTFISDYTLHNGKKPRFCRYWWQLFSIEEILTFHINDSFRIISEQMIRMPKDGDFESILVPGNNEKQNPDESYTNIYQKHTACSYG